MLFKANLFLFFTILLIEIHAKPFLKNPIRTLSTSFLSASLPQDTANISDLRRRKSDKIREFSAKSDDTIDGADAFLSDAGPEDTNEAVPSPLQKKIEHIMRKLHFVAQLITRFNPTNGGADKKEEEAEEEDLDFDSDEDIEDVGGNSTEISANIARGQQEIEEKFNRRGMKEDDDKIGGVQTAATGLGVHLMELLGSLFGLIYGAAIQLTNSTNPKPSL